MREPEVRWILVTAVILTLPWCTAIAAEGDDWQSWALGDPFTIYLEAMFPSIDTQVRLDASDGTQGTTVDFEQNLGMSDSEALPAVGFMWRFAKRHRLRVDAFDLDRSGSAISTTEIRFGDEVFQADLPIASFFDTRVLSVGYSYSLLFDEKKELSLAAGLSVQDISFGLIGEGPLGKIEADAGLTAPLPAFGLTGAYALTDKWILGGGFGYFALKLSFSDEEELSGEIINAAAYIRHNTFEKVHFSLGYTFFDVTADFRSDARLSAISYQYQGPSLGVLAAF
jgi:hypothetical protein